MHSLDSVDWDCYADSRVRSDCFGSIQINHSAHGWIKVSIIDTL